MPPFFAVCYWFVEWCAALFAAVAAVSAAAPSSLPMSEDQITLLIWGILGTALVVGISVLVSLANLGLNLIRAFRGDPPADAKYATKAELLGVESRLETRMDRDNATFKEQFVEIFEQLRIANHSLGRIEGQLHGDKG